MNPTQEASWRRQDKEAKDVHAGEAPLVRGTRNASATPKSSPRDFRTRMDKRRLPASHKRAPKGEKSQLSNPAKPRKVQCVSHMIHTFFQHLNAYYQPIILMGVWIHQPKAFVELLGW